MAKTQTKRIVGKRVVKASSAGRSRPLRPAQAIATGQATDFRADPPVADLLAWAREFLPEYFSDEPSAFHVELMRDLADHSRRLLVRVAPRGHAKSTCASLALPLWALCERQCRNILIISHEASLATQFVRDIRAELDSNDRIRDRYGDLCAPPSATGDAKPRKKKWTESNLTTSSGVTIQAKGSGAALRGVRSGPNRPDLIICDDIECDEQVHNPERRKKLDYWMRRVLLPTLAPRGRVVVIGSLLHFDALLANLRDRQKFPGWDFRMYRALEVEPVAQAEGGSLMRATEFRHVALWPSRWSVERLLEEQERIGTLAFQQEYQANPIDTSTQVFPADILRRYDPEMLDSIAERATVVAVDPAVGKQSGDYFAIWVGTIDRSSGAIYTRELTLEKIDFVQQVRRIISVFEAWRPERVGIESNAYQMALVHTLRDYSARSGLYMPIEPMMTRRNKELRIRGLAPLFAGGSLFLPQNLSRDAELQFLEFPFAGHDDAPDVCAMGVELARRVQGEAGVEGRTDARRALVFGTGGI